MCRVDCHRHSIFCIVPPHVLTSIAQHGNAAQRRAALSALSMTNSIHALRMAQQPRTVRGSRPPRGLAAMTPTVQRTIYDAQHQQNLPGVKVRGEGDPPSGDVAVDEAYDGLGKTFDFYADVFERNSIDDEGLPLNATVHYSQGFDNAFWDGERMIFGDGHLFGRFTASLDVIGHELTHGVTQDEAGLIYFRQSGALNESLSDVFGIMVKQRALNQDASQSDWLIGEELFAGTNLKGVALRSMKAPGTAFDDPVLGKDPQPAHMKDYVDTFDDNGGVHINSGIPNHAFFLVAVALGGYAWEEAGRIWYATVRDAQVQPNTGFRRFARRTVVNAGTLFGAGSPQQQAVIDAWKKVGIAVS
jgi:Zn-dependent metalloprotease